MYVTSCLHSCQLSSRVAEILIARWFVQVKVSVQKSHTFLSAKYGTKSTNISEAALGVCDSEDFTILI